MSSSEALAPLCTSLDELSVSTSVGHARLVLLQAAAALFVGLGQQQSTRQQLLQTDTSQELIGLCLQVRVLAHMHSEHASMDRNKPIETSREKSSF